MHYQIVNKTIFLALLAVVFLIVIIGFYYFATSSSSLTKHTIAVIHESIIHGMAGLGAIAIAVFIFRIESLENRSESLEETTLNFISQTFGLSYPEWT